MLPRILRSLYKTSPIICAGLVSSAAVTVPFCDDTVYESCQAIGDGLRAEIWKARHSNIEVLEPESEPIQLLITKIRNAETSGADFKFYVDRLLALLVEIALGSIDSDEAEFVSPHGYKYQGLDYEDGLDSLCGVTVSRDSNLMLNSFARSVPGMSSGSIYIDSAGDKKQIGKVELPTDISDKQVILLDPVVGRGRSLELAIQTLKTHGVSEDNILVVCITMSPDAADMLKKYKGVSIISATIDAGLDKRGFLVPGLGHFEQRYMAGSE